MPLVDEVIQHDIIEEGQEFESLEDMLIVVDQLEQTAEVMNGVIKHLKTQINDFRDTIALELTAEEFLAEYNDPHALVH